MLSLVDLTLMLTSNTVVQGEKLILSLRKLISLLFTISNQKPNHTEFLQTKKFSWRILLNNHHLLSVNKCHWLSTHQISMTLKHRIPVKIRYIQPLYMFLRILVYVFWKILLFDQSSQNFKIKTVNIANIDRTAIQKPYNLWSKV